MLGGSISVDSSPGQGSRFTLTLATGPVASFIDSAEEARQLQPATVEEKDLIAVTGSVLVAEDNPDNQRLIALNTRRLGAAITIVDNGDWRSLRRWPSPTISFSWTCRCR